VLKFGFSSGMSSPHRFGDVTARRDHNFPFPIAKPFSIDRIIPGISPPAWHAFCRLSRLVLLLPSLGYFLSWLFVFPLFTAPPSVFLFSFWYVSYSVGEYV